MLFAGGFAALPLAVAVAVLRHGLFDVGQLISRAVVFSVLSGLLLIGYASWSPSWASSPRASAGSPSVAAAVAALAAAAGWERAQRAVDRLLYGERRDPFAVATRLGTTLDAAAAPAEALQALADEIARALRLPHVGSSRPTPRSRPSRRPASPVAGDRRRRAAHLHRARTSAACSSPTGTPASGGAAPSAPRSTTPPAGRPPSSGPRAWSPTCRPAASGSWPAREEERRRLRHDLHDGVGPELAGMALQLERLAGKLGGDPDLAALAGRLRDQMRRTVAAVRRAVDDLRPPALDELGLVAALREHVAAYRLPVPAGGWRSRSTASVTAEQLPPLRAAVEVAAYRIATEAVSNAVRHAGASTCAVSLGLSGEDLLVEITDDGRGVPADAVPGVGSTEHAGAGRRARRHPRRDHRGRRRHHRARPAPAGGP